MTAREKVVSAEQQVRALILKTPFPCPDCKGSCKCETCDGSGAVAIAGIECPFCGEINVPAQEVLCCENLADIVNAIMDHVEVKAQLRVMENVYERLVAAEQGMVIH